MLSKQLAFTEEMMLKKGLPQAQVDAGMAIQAKIMKPAIIAPLSIFGTMLWGLIISLDSRNIRSQRGESSYRYPVNLVEI